MKSSWVLVTLAVTALLVIVFLVRVGRRDVQAPGESAQTSMLKGRDDVPREEVQEAQAHGAPQGAGGKTSEPIEVHAKLPAAAQLRPNPRPTAGGLQAGQAEAPPPDDDPDDIPSLTRIVQGDPDPERRLSAVTMLGASDDPQVIPVLAQALSDSDEDVRLAAVQALSDFTGEGVVDAIEPALNDASADIRYEALEVLSDMDAERARPFIEKALSDPDEEVRTLAENLLALDEGGGNTPGAAAAPAPHS